MNHNTPAERGGRQKKEEKEEKEEKGVRIVEKRKRKM
jgi:hypothetical protein